MVKYCTLFVLPAGSSWRCIHWSQKRFLSFQPAFLCTSVFLFDPLFHWVFIRSLPWWPDKAYGLIWSLIGYQWESTLCLYNPVSLGSLQHAPVWLNHTKDSMLIERQEGGASKAEQLLAIQNMHYIRNKTIHVCIWKSEILGTNVSKRKNLKIVKLS